MISLATDAPYAREVRTLFRAALGIFLITVIIGLVNGQKVVVLDRGMLLTHVHAGTLGWITLNVFAVAIWLFSTGKSVSSDDRAGVRRLAGAASAAIGLYVIAFFLFYPGPRLNSALILGIFGTLTLLAIIGLFVWSVGNVGAVFSDVARLAAFGAVTNLTLGAILGVAIEAKLAGLALPDGVFGAHPAMMVVGYLIPIGMAVAEWQLNRGGTGTASMAGILQVGLPIVGGWLIMIGLLTNVIPLVILATLFEVVGAVILIFRIGPRVVRVSWLANSRERVAAISAIFIVVNVVFLFYLVGNYASDFTKAPPGLIVALDHIMFIGVMTNGLFAAIDATRSNRGVAWADQVQFWGMNIGLIGFVVALVSDENKTLMAIFTPIMGISILIAMAAYWTRLSSDRARAM